MSSKKNQENNFDDLVVESRAGHPLPVKRMAEIEIHRHSTFLSRVIFHSDGRPRGWVRKLLLKNRVSGEPRQLAKRLLFKKDGRVRPCFYNWYSKFSASPKMEKSKQYMDFVRSLISAGELQEVRTVHIITTSHTMIIAEFIEKLLESTRFDVSRSTEMPQIFSHDLYIVVAPQMFGTFPPAEKTIFFQMEQVRASRWVTQNYLELMQKSIAILDYSMDNIAALIDLGVPQKQVFYVPIQPVIQFSSLGDERDIDVLFYGSIAAERRALYLDALSRRYNVCIVSNLFGEELRSLLSRAKVVANIHFYENAILETTRISEALAHGADVVSEMAEDNRSMEEFRQFVDFVPVGDVEGFVDRVATVLARKNSAKNFHSYQNFNGMGYHLYRALNGVGVLTFSELLNACSRMEIQQERVILSLPEQLQRYEYAEANQLSETEIFSGLRDIDGWKGCAKSYKFLAAIALRQQWTMLTIYEDDAKFVEGTAGRLEVIHRYLDLAKGEWDVFSGLLSDLSESAIVQKAVDFETESFVHLDSVIGMVFGIYSVTGLAFLADFEFLGEDTSKHTIDRYLEALHPRCVTTIPPVADHADHLTSTLWAADNSATTKMISRSLERLASKRRYATVTPSQFSDVPPLN
ncbi:hypothetical protein [uncultured Agrobacterium sp.]|uniref:hypothetical protein n=1 Tax=uncultured Agrobacterium sp. TaxID=157277 RepID=UPI0025CDD697|nr:hypothetical protein [uncultured Agrobacterium sp.]